MDGLTEAAQVVNLSPGQEHLEIDKLIKGVSELVRESMDASPDQNQFSIFDDELCATTYSTCQYMVEKYYDVLPDVDAIKIYGMRGISCCSLTALRK